MLDIKFIKENSDLIKEAIRKKGVKLNLDELLKIEENRIQLLQLVESLRSEQNKISKEVSLIFDPQEKENKIEDVKKLKEHLKEKEKELDKIMTKWRELMLKVPNIPDISVPEGADESANKEIKRWGETTGFNLEPKSHIDLMIKHKMVDFERGSKAHGFRGYYLINDGALLSFAIWSYALDFWLNKKFIPVIPPVILHKKFLYGTGHLPTIDELEDFYTTLDGQILAGTAEVPLMAYYSDEILSKNDLPKKFIAFSPCFRKEAGSYGKDTKGLFRVNEFYKFEQLILCEASHDESVKYHEEIQRNVEEFIESLRIPYRVVINCTGDLGLGQVKKYDTELWSPYEKKYREISSASYFHDFQSRRLNIRYKDEDGKLRFVHSLNSTAIPTPRILIFIIENYQQEDGSIKIPDVLKKYIGKDAIS